MKVRQDSAGGWSYLCPCGDTHYLSAPTWTFNGDVEKPTFAPSVLVRTGHYAPSAKADAPCWCTYAAEHPGERVFICSVCHSVVTDGVAVFLADCSHALKNMAVPLSDWP